MSEKRWAYLFILSYFIIGAVIIALYNGTGDAGDSILHYLYAKYAPQHLSLFFNHWAKPVYVLLACPFAQFGFEGIKLFNLIVTGASIWLTYKSCSLLQLKNSLVAFLMYIFAPLTFILTFSGLTEPLFALFISLGLYLSLKKQFLWACILLSFLPFVRSEGLIIIGAFSIYLIFRNQWKLLPLLATGHVVYSIIGYFHYHDLFWVFTKIPYANTGSPYGNGQLFHFVEQLQYVVGIPIYIFFWLGLGGSLYMLIKKSFNKELHLFIIGGFFAFFIAHSLFWYFGIFNSMGLNRVLVGVMPFIAIISVIGYNTLIIGIRKVHPLASRILGVFLIALSILFPFTSNPAAVDWKKDLSLNESQECAVIVSEFIHNNHLKSHRIIHIHPYLSEALNIDHFNHDQHLDLSTHSLENSSRGDIVIWDSWFSVVEAGIQEESLTKNTDYKLLTTVTGQNDNTIKYLVFERI